MKFESKNPLFAKKAFTETTTVYDAEGQPVQIIDYNNTMTVTGAVNKSMLLFVLLVTSAFLSCYVMLTQDVSPMVITLGGGITGFLLVVVAGFKPQYSGTLAPAYAVLEGMFVGGISLFMEMMYPGIVLEAVGATLVTFMVCFLLYRFGVVKVTEQFKSVVIAATLAIATYYIISLALSFFAGIELFHRGNSLMSIGFSVFVIVLASLNLFLDFDMIEKGSERRLPKYMEWFGAMGLIITLVWLYVEFLRLFSKIAGRD